MTYHADFWVAVAATAPVIGLAHGVTLGRYEMWRDMVTRRASAILGDLQPQLDQFGERLGEFPDDIVSDDPAFQALGKEWKAFTASFDESRDRVLHSIAIARITRILRIIAAAAWFACLMSMGSAFSALANNEDVVPAWLPANLLVGAMGLLVVQAALEVDAKRRSAKAELGRLPSG